MLARAEFYISDQLKNKLEVHEKRAWYQGLLPQTPTTKRVPQGPAARFAGFKSLATSTQAFMPGNLDTSFMIRQPHLAVSNN